MFDGSETAAKHLDATADTPELTELDRIFMAQQEAFLRNPFAGAAQRIAHLQRLKASLISFQDRIVRAVSEDFGARAADETLLAEFFPSLEGIHHTVKHVGRWMKPERRKVNLVFMPGRARVIYQPLGVVGIIVPWNYPIYLSIGPLTCALAAGNRVMIKMSQSTPNTAKVVQQMIAEAFREDHVAVVSGSPGMGSAFASKPWNHMCFTGSTDTGRQVMRAAADHLTPVTLELGGKSPAIIGPGTPVNEAAERIAFGKMLNSGQTCIAPDYVLCPGQKVEAFISAMKTCVAKMYPRLKANSQFTSIVNARQHERIQAILEDARQQGARVTEINPAGEDFSDTRKMPLYVLSDVTADMRVMQEEIFGLLLPVVPYDSLRDVVAFVNARPRPLALYYFGYDRPQIDYVLNNTCSGGAAVNDVLIHCPQDDLPFGGVGASGMGRYHGKAGFINFSNQKGVLYKPRFNFTKLVYPPYGKIHHLIYKIFIR
ncbi:MAG: coniferyl aldehyde dehydrogenase [Desulfobacteraceae bacterium]|jgi:coniferyl-aldehyde dehydrogenase|nr:MAG: coniferyl aldehyde dehydrogenase [Desulfobacteraceae bacterium]